MKAVREPHVACYITPAFVGRGGESCTHRSRSVPEGIAAYETAKPLLLYPRYTPGESRTRNNPGLSRTRLPIASQGHLVGCIGFEPMHFRLRGGCSTN
jgi:hypothetical protein